VRGFLYFAGALDLILDRGPSSRFSGADGTEKSKSCSRNQTQKPPFGAAFAFYRYQRVPQLSDPGSATESRPHREKIEGGACGIRRLRLSLNLETPIGRPTAASKGLHVERPVSRRSDSYGGINLRRSIFAALLVLPLTASALTPSHAAGDLPPGPGHLLKTPGSGSMEEKIKDCRRIATEIDASKVEITAFEAKIAERTKIADEKEKKLKAEQAKTNLTPSQAAAVNKDIEDFNVDLESRNALVKQLNRMIYEGSSKINSYNTYCTGSFIYSVPK
jgi:hypothetical protein